MKSILGKGFPVLECKNPNYSEFNADGTINTNYKMIEGFQQFNNFTHSNFVPLSERVIFQGFSFVIPMFNDESEPGLYEQVLPELKHLHDIGITEFWWPPPYKALSLNEYKEGYAVSDRYDVGEFNQEGSTRTKYGTREQLEVALKYAHSKGIRNMADIVPNQMYFGTMTVAPCIWCSDNVNMSDALMYYNSFPTSNTETAPSSPRAVCGLNAAWSAGGGTGQETYGLIPQFEYFHVNGFNPSTGILSNGSGTGMYCVLRDKNFIPYRFYGNGNPKNYLPDWLQNAYDQNNYITIQSTDTYLLITQGWVDFVHFIPYACFYQEEYDVTALGEYSIDAGSGERSLYIPTPSNKNFVPDMRDGSHTDDSYRLLIQRQRFLDYLKALPIDPSISTSTSDEDLISWIKNYVGSNVGYQMSQWVAEQPGYGGLGVYKNGYGYYTQSIETKVVSQTTTKTVSVDGNGITVGDTTSTSSQTLSDSTTTSYIGYVTTGSTTTSNTVPGSTTTSTKIEDGITSTITSSTETITTVTTTNTFHGSSWVVWNQNPSTNDDTVMTNFMMDIITKNHSNSSDIEGEFLLGTDINNENIDVLYDTVNWQKFLINLGFDGFRFDAAGWYSNKILTNSGILMTNLFGKDIINHISVLEDYGDNQHKDYLSSWYNFKDVTTYGSTSEGNVTIANMGYTGYVNFPQLSYNTALYYSLESTVMKGFSSGSLLTYFQGIAGGSHGAFSINRPYDYDLTLLPSLKDSFVGGQFRGGNDDEALQGTNLNWSLCNNHDMELNDQIRQYPTNDGSDNSTLLGLMNSCEQYCYDRRIRNKVTAHKNIVMSYALMLMNDFTVPTVFYGDMYDPHKPYMSTKSPYYAGIELMLKIRKRYVKGQQFNEFYSSNTDESTNWDQAMGSIIDAAAVIRFGDSRDTGCVLVISTNENLSFTITVPFSWQHANQTMKNVFAIGEEYSRTDSAGNFEVFVTPENTPITQGYMSLWIPI